MSFPSPLLGGSLHPLSLLSPLRSASSIPHPSSPSAHPPTFSPSSLPARPYQHLHASCPPAALPLLLPCSAFMPSSVPLGLHFPVHSFRALSLAVSDHGAPTGAGQRTGPAQNGDHCQSLQPNRWALAATPLATPTPAQPPPPHLPSLRHPRSPPHDASHAHGPVPTQRPVGLSVAFQSREVPSAGPRNLSAVN